MRKFSKTAWTIAMRYSRVLASETRDLAAEIDAALLLQRPAPAGEIASLIAKLRQDVITGGGIVEITEAELEQLIAAIPTPLPTDCPEQSRSTP